VRALYNSLISHSQYSTAESFRDLTVDSSEQFGKCLSVTGSLSRGNYSRSNLEQSASASACHWDKSDSHFAVSNKVSHMVRDRIFWFSNSLHMYPMRRRGVHSGPGSIGVIKWVDTINGRGSGGRGELQIQLR
jgi:hypothetical protein